MLCDIGHATENLFMRVRRLGANAWFVWMAILVVSAMLGCADEDAPPDPIAPQVMPLSGGKVQWTRWEQRDPAQDRPILLFLYSQRAFWCRDLVVQCFDDGRLARDIQRITLPIWVDADRRPDVFERYGMGGLPTVAFLKSDGALITGSTYLDPADLDDLLRRVFILSDNPKRMATLEEQRRELLRRERLLAQENPRPMLALTPLLAARAIDSVRVAAVRGDALGAESLLALIESEVDSARQVGIQRLLAEATVRQGADGVFFLSALTADGHLVDREKHLGVNAELLLAFARAAQLTGRSDLRAVAERLGDALRRRFETPEDSLLCAGWAGWTDSEGQSLRDSALYSGWNAAAISGLLALYDLVQKPELLADCRRIFDGLRVRFCREDGLFLRLEDARGPVFLEDQALILRAALDLYDATQQQEILAFARNLAHLISKDFADASGALRDRTPESGRAITPAVDRWLPSGNGVAAQAFTRLATLVGDETYRVAANRLIAALCGPHIDDIAYAGALIRGVAGFLETDTLHGK